MYKSSLEEVDVTEDVRKEHSDCSKSLSKPRNQTLADPFFLEPLFRLIYHPTGTTPFPWTLPQSGSISLAVRSTFKENPSPPNSWKLVSASFAEVVFASRLPYCLTTFDFAAQWLTKTRTLGAPHSDRAADAMDKVAR
ncbi:hypothetical protein TYRP_016750 [Tyrophagus putrescentiae]|nr:hypothetical protein TYRP_022539 [Tyrophagus putrescentiae]KAH9401367.1 hypothetical protein TYRP_016750 [Tyrophagus putrescentiae]